MGDDFELPKILQVGKRQFRRIVTNNNPLDDLRLQSMDAQAEHDFLRIRELKAAMFKAHQYLVKSSNPKDWEVAEMLLKTLLGKTTEDAT